MQYRMIPLDHLSVGKTNVRKRGGKEVGDLVPSIRAVGLLQPLLVRTNGADDHFEIVAGQRRYHALRELAEEGEGKEETDADVEAVPSDAFDPVPCIVMDDADDAAAIEASLAENVARLPMDEIDQYKAFAALVRQGMEAEEIASRFGVTERLVRQRMAIANLISPILTLYRKQEIDAHTLRQLTLAPKEKQKEWIALVDSDEDYAPTGHTLKSWLFGGAEIGTDVALFDLDTYGGEIVGDLFGERSYFSDAATFWPLQSAAIAAMRDAYLADGWGEVIVLDTGEHFARWEHVEADKDEGGRVVIEVAHNGQVTPYEGVLTRKEAAKRSKARDGEGKEENDTPAPKAEITKAMQTYLNLHRHAAVRLALLDHPQIALRLMAAHVITGSPLWRVDPEPQQAGRTDIADSLSASSAEQSFREVCAVIDALTFSDDGKGSGLAATFARLLDCEDAEVVRILTILMARSLEAGTGLVEVLAAMMAVDMTAHWQPDETWFDLLREKALVNAMVAEFAGEHVARDNLTETTKVQKRIIADCLNGTRTPNDPAWYPRHMRVPMDAYRDAEAIDVIRHRERIAPLFAAE